MVLDALKNIKTKHLYNLYSIKQIIIKNNKKGDNMFKNKKAQLGIIEFKFFFIGLIIGITVTIVLILLANKGILPFSMKFLCPAAAG